MTEPIARDPIYRRRRFQSETIELCVRWYLTYRLSYRDLVEMMAERDVTVSHSSILRWLQLFSRGARYEKLADSPSVTRSPQPTSATTASSLGGSLNLGQLPDYGLGT